MAATRASSGLVLLAAATQLLHFAAAAPRTGSAAPSHDPWAGNATITKELFRLSDWIMSTDVGTNVLKGINGTDQTSIFINGDSARVLLAASKIAKQAGVDKGYLQEGLRWCDSFTKLQIPIVTSSGAAGGFWNTGYNEIFIADTGTAVTALALCATMQPDSVKVKAYRTALGKFALFVSEGCKEPPTTMCSKEPYPGCRSNVSKVLGPDPTCPKAGAGTEGWVIRSGHDTGGLGDGWYESKLNDEVYTISTATSGSCAFVETAALPNVEGFFPPGASKLDDIAKGAVRWLLASRLPNGRIPYTISPADPLHTIFQPITYSTESMIICDLRYPELHTELSTLKSTVHWLIDNQNKDGSWGNFTPGVFAASRKTATPGKLRSGFSPSGDAQRSPRALSLLQWYASRVEPGEASVVAAINKYLEFILNRKNSADFGVAQKFGHISWSSPMVTGFVGLALADLVMPWCTFNPVA